MNLKDRRKNIARMNEIARVLIKYGFDTFAHQIGLNNSHISLNTDEELSEEFEGVNLSLRIRLVLQELGTTFIKLGQTLSTYPNLIGYELSEELSKLQESAPIDKYEDVKKTIESELNCSIENVFEEFTEKPIASASIGQVHSAYVENKHVAVKVQHTNIQDTIKSDIKIMKTLAYRIDKSIPMCKPYNLPGLVEVFEKDMRKEIDYNYELSNMIHLSDLLKDDEVYIPKAYPKYSTGKVLTMEYLEGVSLKKVLNSSNDVYDKKYIANTGADSFIKQILIHGFFHADPHPGNIFILDNNIVAFVDFGMVGHINREFQENLSKLFIFIADSNPKLLTKQLYYMGIIKDRKHQDDIEYEIMNILDSIYGRSFNDVSGVLRSIMEDNLLNKYGLVIPRDLMLVIRTITMIDDIGKILDPDFNELDLLKPYSMQILFENVKPKKLFDKLSENYLSLQQFGKKLPDSLSNLIDVFEEGQIKFSLEVNELNNFSNILTKIANELVIAIITAALIVGSSLVMLKDTEILILGYPFIGFIGFTFSAILGVILVIMIIRGGNYH